MKEFVRISDVNAIIDDRIKRIKDSGRTRLTPAELNLNIVRKMVNDLDMSMRMLLTGCRYQNCRQRRKHE